MSHCSTMLGAKEGPGHMGGPPGLSRKDRAVTMIFTTNTTHSLALYQTKLPGWSWSCQQSYCQDGTPRLPQLHRASSELLWLDWSRATIGQETRGGKATRRSCRVRRRRWQPLGMSLSPPCSAPARGRRCAGGTGAAGAPGHSCGTAPRRWPLGSALTAPGSVPRGCPPLSPSTPSAGLTSVPCGDKGTG